MDVSPWSWAAIAVMGAAVAVIVSKKFFATGTLLIANAVIFLMDVMGPTRTSIPTWAGPEGLAAGNFVSQLNAELAFNGTNLAHLHPLGFMQTFTAMFMHGSFPHILGNSLFLFAFGMPFEERIGPRRFLAIYLIGGLAATIVQFSFVPDGRALGASGAIAAIMGAFAAKYPRLVVPLPIPLFIVMMLPVPVFIGVGIYLLLNFVDVLLLNGNLSGSGVGYAAHLGGMAAGALLSFAILRHVVATGKGREGRVAVDLPKLAPFARDAATQQVLAHMQTNHDEPAVFQAWLDKFFRTATCPTCTHRVMPGSRGQVVCTQGHKFDVKTAPPAKPGATPPP